MNKCLKQWSNNSIFFLSLFLSISCNAQQPTLSCTQAIEKVVALDSLLQEYDFIKKDKYTLQNDTPSLNNFYKKVYNLRKNKEGKIKILHVGDSHMQADFLSSITRGVLQHYFGNAGRGLLFPYKYANTNGPGSYLSNSIIPWGTNKVLLSPHTGICGYSLTTQSLIGDMVITLKNQHGHDYKSTKVTMFHQRTQDNFLLDCYDTKSSQKAVKDSIYQYPNATTLCFQEPVEEFYLTFMSTDTINPYKRLDGIYLENNEPGITYNMVGVNGAKYSHYNNSANFAIELQALQPDLVIFSMGTNEAFGAKNLDPDEFASEVQKLVTTIKNKCPETSILLTTPPDSYKNDTSGRKSKNPNVKIAQQTIIQYAKDNQIAYWDLLELIGGYGCMNKWAAANMTDALWIHFSKQGYEIQGALLAKGIIKGFEKFCEKRKYKLP